MNKRIFKLAPNGKRIIAYIIDSVIPFIFLSLIIALCIATSNEPDDSQMMDPFGMYGFNDDFFDYGNTMDASTGLVIALLIMSLVYLVYITIQIFFYTKSKTIGKAIMGLQVVSSKNGEPVGVWWMLLREWLVKKVSKSVFWIGYLWSFIDDKKRTWHDKICDTYVVEVKGENAEQI